MKMMNNTYNLKITTAEAKALHDILELIGGHPKNSRRRIADRILKAVSELPGAIDQGRYAKDLTGEIIFKHNNKRN